MLPTTATKRRTTKATATKQRIRRRRGATTRLEPHELLHPQAAACIGIGLLGCVFLFLCLLWKVQDLVFNSSLPDHGIIDEPSIFRRGNGNNNDDDDNNDNAEINVFANKGYDNIITHMETNYVVDETRRAPPNNNRLLIFQPIGSGQGQGNIMAGLLAAHLLADEFNRVVCVSKSYTSFLSVFEPVHPWAIEKCRNVPDDHHHHHNMHGAVDDSIRLVTFEKPPNECALQQKLLNGSDTLYITSNTYPRWPKVPKNYFFRFYKPKPILLQTLPYYKSPTTVVHLREGDNDRIDQRQGTDPKTLQALGRMLPSDTFLVTNRVEWYDMFSQQYGWSNPGWEGVTHSALGKSWGVRGEKFKGATSSMRRKGGTKASPKTQRLQLWSDWYTILTASKVYHSHSDFSISAVHWVGSSSEHSQVLLNYDTVNDKPGMAAESYVVDGITPPLKDRTVNGTGTNQLRLCNTQNGVGGGFMNRVRNRFGLFHDDNKDNSEEEEEEEDEGLDDNIY